MKNSTKWGFGNSQTLFLHMKTTTSQALFFILFTICLDAIGIGIIIPSFPSLIADVADVSFNESSSYFGWVMGSYAFMQFVFSPFIGNLSDRYGRRPVLLISVFGLGLDYIFMYFAPDLFWLVLGRCISGMFGASYTTAAAYIADISTDENRTKNFGLIGAAFGIGFVLGPAIGGLITSWGPRAPFLVAACFSLANLLFGFFVLKESLAVENRRKFDWKRANPFGAFKQIKQFTNLKWLFLVSFTIMLANMGVHSTWNYFTMEKFAWTEREVGISLAVVGVCFGLVQGGLSGWIAKKLGERGSVILGLSATILITAIMAINPYSLMMYILILPYALTGIVDPNIRSLVSSKTASDQQGEIQGIFSSLMSLAEIVGPPAMMALYYFTTTTFKGNPLSFSSPLFASSLFAGIALLILFVTYREKK